MLTAQKHWKLSGFEKTLDCLALLQDDLAHVKNIERPSLGENVATYPAAQPILSHACSAAISPISFAIEAPIGYRIAPGERTIIM
jgi:hypothetical protein